MGIEVVTGALDAQSVEAMVFPVRASETLRVGMAVLAATPIAPFRGTIHVADRDANGRSSEAIIVSAVQNILALVEKENFWSVGIPVLGVDPVALPEPHALAIMLLTIRESQFMGGVTIVKAHHGKR